MKVEFDWKKFVVVKPDKNVDIIFKYKDDLFLGKYVDVEVMSGANIFSGCRLRLKSLSKKNSETVCVIESNIGEVIWDYYNSTWV